MERAVCSVAAGRRDASRGELGAYKTCLCHLGFPGSVYWTFVLRVAMLSSLVRRGVQSGSLRAASAVRLNRFSSTETPSKATIDATFAEDRETPLRHNLTAGDIENMLPHVRRVLDLQLASQEELNKIAVTKARQTYARHESDTGSPEVQAAILTARINYMTAHLQQHRKDVHNRHGLEKMIHKRRKLLKYLRRRDPSAFDRVTSELGIRVNTI